MSDTPFGPSGVDTERQSPSRATDEMIMECMKAAGGNITKTAQNLTLSGYPIRRASLQARIDSTPDLLVAKRELIDEVLDMAEDNVFELIKRGDAAESHYALDRLGKDRGWVTRQENKNMEPLQVAVRTFSEPNSPPDAE